MKIKKVNLVLEVKDKSSAMTQIPKDVKRRKKDKKKSKNSAKTNVVLESFLFCMYLGSFTLPL